MVIGKECSGTKLILSVEGRLDTLTAPELEKEINASLGGVEEIVFDFSKLEYISSAGLRVLLSAQKKAAGKGGCTVTGANETVKEIFDITGFADILNIV